MSEVQAKSVNRLTAKQLYEVCKYLEDLSPTFDHTTTYPALAVKVSDHFGYTVSHYSIKTCFEMADLSIPKPPIGENQKFAIMKRAIEALYMAHAMPLPLEWSDL